MLGEDWTRGRRGGLFKCDTGSRSLDRYITNSCRPIGQLCVRTHARALACTCAREKLHNKQRSALARDRCGFTSGDDTPPVVVRGSAGFSINYEHEIWEHSWDPSKYISPSLTVMRENPSFSPLHVACVSVCVWECMWSVHKFYPGRSPDWSLWDSTPAEGSYIELRKSCEEPRSAEGDTCTLKKKTDVDINSNWIFHLPHTLSALELYVYVCVRVHACVQPVALSSIALPETWVLPCSNFVLLDRNQCHTAGF